MKEIIIGQTWDVTYKRRDPATKELIALTGHTIEYIVRKEPIISSTGSTGADATIYKKLLPADLSGLTEAVFRLSKEDTSVTPGSYFEGFVDSYDSNTAKTKPMQLRFVETV